jgi:hypothetical protein
MARARGVHGLTLHWVPSPRSKRRRLPTLTKEATPMASRAPNDRARLLQILARSDDDEIPATIPVFGAGLNTQAGIVDGWSQLLATIRTKLQIDPSVPEPASQTAKWECYLRHLSSIMNIQPHDAEEQLQKLVAMQLREKQISGATSSFFRRVLRLGFRDIITLNFDLHLETSSDSYKNFGEGRGKLRKSSLYRRNEVRFADARHPIRIWHPHGDVARYSSIRLGTRLYGLYIQELERMRGNFMQYAEVYSSTPDRGRDIEVAQTRDFVRLLPHPNWLALFMHQPIVFFGTSLSTDEWPMWWALHERARYQNRMAIPIPTAVAVVVKPGQESPKHLLGKPANLELLEFPSYDDLWEPLFHLESRQASAKSTGRTGP